MTSFTQNFSLTATASNTNFTISGGKFIAPGSGGNWIGKGINVADWAAVGGGGPNNTGNGTCPLTGGSSGSIIAGQDGTYIFTLFPNCNVVRLNCEKNLTKGSDGYNDAASNFTTFINNMTAKNVVVILEDHDVSNSTGYSQAQLNWYTNMATAFKNNPYVWYGTVNEPGNASSVIAAQLQVYNAIRNAGATAPIAMQINYPSTTWANQNSTFSQMTNVYWEPHFYGYAMGHGMNGYSNYDTNLTDIKTLIASIITQIQTGNGNSSKDGVMPVMWGEFGPSTSGSLPSDPNGTQAVTAVLQSGMGSTAWTWGEGDGDRLQNNGNITTFGSQIKNYMDGGTIPNSWTE